MPDTIDGQLVVGFNPIVLKGDKGDPGAGIDPATGLIDPTLLPTIPSAKIPDLSASYLPRGATTVSGTQAAPLIDITNSSDQASLHIHGGNPTARAPYLIGVGVDTDNTTGLTVSVKQASDIGIALSLETTSALSCYGMYGQNLSSGQLVTLVSATGGTGAVLTVANSGGTGNLFQWSASSGVVNGFVDSTGKFTSLAVSRFSDYTLVNNGSAPNAGLTVETNRGGGANTEMRFYRWTGGANSYFPFRITAGAGAGDEIAIGAGTGGSTVDGSETINNMIRISNFKIGLYGVAPVLQPSRVGQLTDSTGGTVSSTLAAGITDSVAKNAIASLAAKVNSLELALHNLGVTA